MVQPYNEGHKLEALMTELNAYYNEESNCQEMNIQDVCGGKHFAKAGRSHDIIEGIL